MDDADGNLRSPLLRPSKNSPPQKLCIDEMLQKYCGEFGRWQMKHFVLTSLAWALEAFHTMVMIFADREPGWRCVVGGGGCGGSGGGVCGLEPGSWEWIGGSGSSTVAEWGLVCEEKYKVGLVQSLFFGGCMIGAGIFGHLSDSFLGRKGSLTVVCIINAAFGILTAFSPNYWTYALLRLLTGFATGGVGLCAFVLATEPVGPSKRGIAGMSTFYFFSTGIALLSVVAYLFNSWRSLYVASSVPSLLFLFVIVPFVSESPRWFLIRGKPDKALEIMREIAKYNGKSLPDNVVLALDEETKEPTNGENDAKQAVSGSLMVYENDPTVLCSAQRKTGDWEQKTTRPNGENDAKQAISGGSLIVYKNDPTVLCSAQTNREHWEQRITSPNGENDVKQAISGSLTGCKNDPTVLCSTQTNREDWERRTTSPNGENDGKKQAISGSLIDVVRLPLTRVRLILSVAINFLCSVVYYGLSLNVVNLGTNIYLNTFLNAVAEMPAYLLTAVLVISRNFGFQFFLISKMNSFITNIVCNRLINIFRGRKSVVVGVKKKEKKDKY